MILLGLDGLILFFFFIVVLISLFKPGHRRVVSVVALSISLPLLLASSYIFSNYGLSARIRDITLLTLSIAVTDKMKEVYLSRKEIFIGKEST
jgi:hypothetical protein